MVLRSTCMQSDSPALQQGMEDCLLPLSKSGFCLGCIERGLSLDHQTQIEHSKCVLQDRFDAGSNPSSSTMTLGTQNADVHKFISSLGYCHCRPQAAAPLGWLRCSDHTADRCTHMGYDFSVDGVRRRAQYIRMRTLGEFRGWWKVSGADFGAALWEPMSS